MTEELNNKKIIVFLENTAPIIFEIIEKYGLDKTKEAAEKGHYFQGGPILKITENIALSSGSQNELALALQKELNISADVANKIADDIKNRLFPMAKIMLEKEYLKLCDKAIKEKGESGKNSITAKPIKLIDQAVTTLKTEPPQTESIKTPEPVKEKILPKKFIDEKTSESKKPDNYREPIE